MSVNYGAIIIYGAVKKIPQKDINDCCINETGNFCPVCGEKLEEPYDIDEAYPDLDVVILGYDESKECIVGREAVSVDDPEKPQKLCFFVGEEEKDIESKVGEPCSYFVVLNVG